MTQSERKTMTPEKTSPQPNIVEEGISRMTPSSSEILFPAQPA